MKPGTEEELRRTGLLHLTRSIELYREQIRDGLYFPHEFPSGSTSVLAPVLQDLLKTPGVMKVRGPMCVWGMTSSDAQGEGLVKKETYWVTNSRFTARELDRSARIRPWRSLGIGTFTLPTTEHTRRGFTRWRWWLQSSGVSENNFVLPER